MKALGNISHITNSGNLVVRSSATPPAGGLVLNKDKKKIGKIKAVFGPTKKPFIAVAVFKSVGLETFEDNIGEELFVSNQSPKKNKRRSKGKFGNNSNKGKFNNNSNNNNNNSNGKRRGPRRKIN
ncbi:MAG: H/ACA ribonucleoprotein complex subunit GAR1 [Methanobacteriaceae archaeon]